MKAVLITGASRGIGRALCVEAAKRGYRVHVVVRNAQDAPSGATAHVADVREREKISAILERLAPEINVFIANAGVDASHDPRDPGYAERAAAVFEINGTATAYSVFRLAHLWATAGARNRRLAVVSSLAAGRGLPRAGAYIATKTAQLSLCQSLERDLARFGIGVSVIQPGFVDTDMSRKQALRPMLISPERAAAIIWDGLEKGRFRVAFPLPIALVTGLLSMLPYRVFRRIVIFMQARHWL